jgi:alpha-galactosidase
MCTEGNKGSEGGKPGNIEHRTSNAEHRTRGVRSAECGVRSAAFYLLSPIFYFLTALAAAAGPTNDVARPDTQAVVTDTNGALRGPMTFFTANAAAIQAVAGSGGTNGGAPLASSPTVGVTNVGGTNIPFVPPATFDAFGAAVLATNKGTANLNTLGNAQTATGPTNNGAIIATATNAGWGGTNDVLRAESAPFTVNTWPVHPVREIDLWYSNQNGTNETEAFVYQQIDIEATNWSMAPYNLRYMQLDDLQLDHRDSNGNLELNTTRYPGGLAGYIHKCQTNGIIPGVYIEPNTTTSGGIIGSAGHLEQDGTYLGSVGIGIVKFDGATQGRTEQDALNLTRQFANSYRRASTNHPSVMEIDKGFGHTSKEWLELGNMVRDQGDFCCFSSTNDEWIKFLGYVDSANAVAPFTGPHHWSGWDNSVTLISPADDRDKRAVAGPKLVWQSQFGIGVENVRGVVPVHDMFLTNATVMQIMDDPLSIPPILVSSNATQEVFVRELANGFKAVCLLNRTTNTTQSIQLNWTDCGFGTNQLCDLREWWGQTNAVRGGTSHFTASVGPCDDFVGVLSASVNTNGPGLSLPFTQSITQANADSPAIGVSGISTDVGIALLNLKPATGWGNFVVGPDASYEMTVQFFPYDQYAPKNAVFDVSSNSIRINLPTGFPAPTLTGGISWGLGTTNYLQLDDALPSPNLHLFAHAIASQGLEMTNGNKGFTNVGPTSLQGQLYMPAIPAGSLLGTMATSNAGAITVGSGLSLSGGTLSATGGAGSTNDTTRSAGSLMVSNNLTATNAQLAGIDVTLPNVVSANGETVAAGINITGKDMVGVINSVGLPYMAVMNDTNPGPWFERVEAASPNLRNADNSFALNDVAVLRGFNVDPAGHQFSTQYLQAASYDQWEGYYVPTTNQGASIEEHWIISTTDLTNTVHTDRVMTRNYFTDPNTTDYRNASIGWAMDNFYWYPPYDVGISAPLNSPNMSVQSLASGATLHFDTNSFLEWDNAALNGSMIKALDGSATVRQVMNWDAANLRLNFAPNQDFNGGGTNGGEFTFGSRAEFKYGSSNLMKIFPAAVVIDPPLVADGRVIAKGTIVQPNGFNLTDSSGFGLVESGNFFNLGDANQGGIFTQSGSTVVQDEGHNDFVFASGSLTVPVELLAQNFHTPTNTPVDGQLPTATGNGGDTAWKSAAGGAASSNYVTLATGSLTVSNSVTETNMSIGGTLTLNTGSIQWNAPSNGSPFYIQGTPIWTNTGTTMPTLTVNTNGTGVAGTASYVGSGTNDNIVVVQWTTGVGAATAPIFTNTYTTGSWRAGATNVVFMSVLNNSTETDQTAHGYYVICYSNRFELWDTSALGTGHTDMAAFKIEHF